MCEAARDEASGKHPPQEVCASGGWIWFIFALTWSPVHDLCTGEGKGLNLPLDASRHGSAEFIEWRQCSLE